MDNKDEPGTDAASIKPVSSLLSHFEGLKSERKQRRDSPSRETGGHTATLEAPHAVVPVRASFDMARPSSPWNSDAAATRKVAQAPVEQARNGRTSPTKSLHKRPISMHMSSQPPPSVKIESPRSPPQTFFQRSASRSPERPDTTPFGKVRELIAQRSSQPTTRSNTPPSDNGQLNTKPVYTGTSRHVSRNSSPARQPPPVNRSEKPKIPAKPPAISRPNGGTLTPEPQSRRPSMDARISPFSTPPSSGDNSPEDSPLIKPPIGPSPFSPAETLSSLASETPETPEFPGDEAFSHAYEVDIDSDRTKDARMMGFSSVRTVVERRDPRSLGFGGSQNKQGTGEPQLIGVSRSNTGLVAPSRKDARDSGFSHKANQQSTHEFVPKTPSRAQTVVENPKPKDPREFGFSAARSGEQSVKTRSATGQPQPTPAMRSLPPLSAQNNSSPNVATRDPRQFGFKPSTASVTSGPEEQRPSLPMRRAGQEPPPRPSDNSKPSMQTPAREQGLRHIDKAKIAAPVLTSKQVSQSTTEISFPPPPKRSTFNEEDHTVPMIKPAQRSTTVGSLQSTQSFEEYDSDDAKQLQAPISIRADYPDATKTNRRSPYSLEGPHEINARADAKVFDVCGRYLCVSGYTTRVFDMASGEQIMAVSHGESVKVTAVKFKPGRSLDEEGTSLWLGNNIGDLQEIDIETQTVLAQSSAHGRREIIRILRYRRNLITLDEDGKLFTWRADQSGTPNLKGGPLAQKVPKGHTFSMIIQDKLWLATGKDIRLFQPGSDAQFIVSNKVLTPTGTGDITSGAYTREKGGRVYFGHSDGKISIYSTLDYTCAGIVKASDYKINSLCFVGDKLWAAYKTGKVYVYDTLTSPWKVKKDWRAHTGPIHSLILDPSSVWNLQRLQVVTAGHDNYIRLWDGTLEEDWIEHAMQERDVSYCTFRELKVAVVTWNVGAIVPAMLRDDFIADAIHAEDAPDLVVFGFQEVVDLEDRAVTAKSLLGFAKKKEATKPDQQHQSRVYREWRDYLARCLDRFTNSQCSYSELHMSSLIGLFQCIFVRQEERRSVSMLAAANVKCGMGGHYGNKGALVSRFVLDDSSICFTNCHLAAGQSQTSHRNNDIATILESEALTGESNRKIRSSLFVGGGDGTQILDHEICILNGDLNYRIDTIPRDTVIRMIRNNELAKLLERDQLLVSRRRVSGFKLSAFTELPLTFAPTYKYDPGTDNYDSSEKKRAPAWCDRILYRGSGRVKQLEYRRHEAKVSDHRPVSALFKIRIKKINADKRDKTMDECYHLFKTAKKELAENVCIQWLVDVMGVTPNEAHHLLVG